MPYSQRRCTYGWGFGVLMAVVYSVILLAQNWSLLQQTLGMRDEGVANDCVYLALPLCALCQEARAVDRDGSVAGADTNAPGEKGRHTALILSARRSQNQRAYRSMFVTIIALFVAYWYAVIALYFYWALNSNAAMVSPIRQWHHGVSFLRPRCKCQITH